MLGAVLPISCTLLAALPVLPGQWPGDCGPSTSHHLQPSAAAVFISSVYPHTAATLATLGDGVTI